MSSHAGRLKKPISEISSDEEWLLSQPSAETGTASSSTPSAVVSELLRQNQELKDELKQTKEGAGTQIATKEIFQCEKCQSNKVMVGSNRYGKWRKCLNVLCKHKWDYQPFEKMTSTTRTDKTKAKVVEVLNFMETHWRRLSLWMMIGQNVIRIQALWDKLALRNLRRVTVTAEVVAARP
jgi:hypothetical protein